MKFGLLHYRDTGNLGDEIQSLAARDLLPRVDCYADRDDLGGFGDGGGDPVALIVHGWFGHTPERWPPAPAIRPLLVSLHISELPGFGPSGLSARDFFLTSPALDYLKAHAPIGARDLAMAALLEQSGIAAYFSGCLSLLLAPRAAPKHGGIVLNDVRGEIAVHLRARTRRPIIVTTHMDRAIAAREARFARAEELLAIYAGAHCVITTRLHCALPCLALGTPVLLLDTAPDRGRFSGLESLYRHCTPADFLAGRCAFDWENPEPNRRDFERPAAALRARVAAFVAAAEDGALPPAAMDAQTAATARRDTLRALLARSRGTEAGMRQALAVAELEIARLRGASAPARSGDGRPLTNILGADRR